MFSKRCDSAANPMTRPDVDAKCFDLMAPVFGKTRARKLIDTVWNIEKVTDMRSLRPLLLAHRPLASNGRRSWLVAPGPPWQAEFERSSMVPGNRADIYP